MSSIFDASIQPSLPSAIRISFHSFIEESVISTFVPSCRINRSVPFFEGVLFTCTAGDITIAPVRLTSWSFCCQAKMLDTAKSISMRSAPKNHVFCIHTLDMKR